MWGTKWQQQLLGECPWAVSQNRRVSGLTKKIPPSCGPWPRCHLCGSVFSTGKHLPGQLQAVESWKCFHVGGILGFLGVYCGMGRVCEV